MKSKFGKFAIDACGGTVQCNGTSIFQDILVSYTVQRDLDVLEGILKIRSSQPSHIFADFNAYTVPNFDGS